MKIIEIMKQELITVGIEKITLRQALDKDPSNEALKESWYIACHRENQAFLALQEATSTTDAFNFYNENVVKHFI